MSKQQIIAIEAFSLSEETLGGIGKATKNILYSIQRLDRENIYIVYFNGINRHLTITNPMWTTVTRDNVLLRLHDRVKRKAIRGAPGYIMIISIALRIVRKFINLLYELSIPFRLWHQNVDVYVAFSSNYFPLFFFGKIRKTILIYDLVWKLFPYTMEFLNRWKTRAFAQNNMRRADFLMSISESTKDDIVKILGEEKKIITIHLAADKEIFYQAPKKEKIKIREKYGISGNYILSVCTIEPRKNIETLIKSLSLIEKPLFKLVLVGKAGWINSKFFQMIENPGIRKNIIVTGYVPDEDLAALYSDAMAFILPTLYEGFGLPVLEAMQCGCPVIASNNSSIPEVAGNAGLLFDAMDEKELASLILKVSKDSALRKRMSAKGLKRAEGFSWALTAKKVKDAIFEQKE